MKTSSPDSQTITEPSFEALLVSVGQTADREAFIDIFKHFAPRIKSYLMRGGLSAEIADELAQDTMLSVWKKASHYNPSKAAASTWIFTIARNKRIDYLRKAARPEPDYNEPVFDYTGQELTPDDYTHSREERRLIKEALDTLPEEQAVLLHKSFFEDKTHQDIAQETDLPLGTVKSRIRLAMDRLRHILNRSHSGKGGAA